MKKCKQVFKVKWSSYLRSLNEFKVAHPTCSVTACTESPRLSTLVILSAFEALMHTGWFSGASLYSGMEGKTSEHASIDMDKRKSDSVAVGTPLFYGGIVCILKMWLRVVRDIDFQWQSKDPVNDSEYFYLILSWILLLYGQIKYHISSELSQATEDLVTYSTCIIFNKA